MNSKCQAITSKSIRCSRNNDGRPSGYCGIHLNSLYKKPSQEKLTLLSELCSNILKFNATGIHAYTSVAQLQSSGPILKRGSHVIFEAKNNEKILRDNIILLRDIYQTDFLKFISVLYKTKFDSVYIL